MKTAVLLCLAVVVFQVHADEVQTSSVVTKMETVPDHTLKIVDGIVSLPSDDKVHFELGPHVSIIPDDASLETKRVNLHSELENGTPKNGKGDKDKRKRRIMLKKQRKEVKNNLKNPKRKEKVDNKKNLNKKGTFSGKLNNKKRTKLTGKKDLKTRNKKQLRNLSNSRKLIDQDNAIVEKIIAENNKGQPSSVSTAYLRQRIRALLMQQRGGFTWPKCSDATKGKKVKDTKRQRELKKKLIANRKNRKQTRNLNLRGGKKNRKLNANKANKAKGSKGGKAGDVVINKNNANSGKDNAMKVDIVLKGEDKNTRKNNNGKKNNGKGRRNNKRNGKNKGDKKSRPNRIFQANKKDTNVV